MKDISKLIDNIPFSDALEKDTLHNIYETLNDQKKELLPKTLKVFLLAVSSWSISLFSGIIWFVFPVSSLAIIIYGLVFYFKSPIYLKKVAYNSTIYLFVQNALIFYICSLEISNSVLLNRSVSTIYIVLSYTLALYVIKIKLIDSVQEKYLPENKKSSKKRSIKIVRGFSTILVTFITISIIVMQFYRFNKWWIDNNDFNFLSGLNGSLVGNILSIVSVFIGIFILIIVSLTPTLLVGPEILADGLILQRYSEEFRIEYGFTKKEWYSE